jgi:hypothetical protein
MAGFSQIHRFLKEFGLNGGLRNEKINIYNHNDHAV